MMFLKFRDLKFNFKKNYGGLWPKETFTPLMRLRNSLTKCTPISVRLKIAKIQIFLKLPLTSFRYHLIPYTHIYVYYVLLRINTIFFNKSLSKLFKNWNLDLHLFAEERNYENNCDIFSNSI